jgi:uncharacterized RDD family membrane protein YckC
MPPPPPPAAFIVRGDDGEEYGPVDLAELREWVRENRAGLGTVVRSDRPDSPWQPWQSFPELVALLAEAQSGAVPPVPAALVIAPPLRRMGAFVLDLILIFFLICPVLRVTIAFCPPEVYEQLTNSFQNGTYVPPQFPIFYYFLLNGIVYGVAMLYLAGFTWRRGQTPGKGLLGLRVVDRNGLKPELGRALARSLVLVFTLFFWGLPFIAVLFNPQRRGLHDLAAGTCVVEA